MPTRTSAVPATTSQPATEAAIPQLATATPAGPQPAAAAPPETAAVPDIDVARLRVAILRLSRQLRKHDLADLTPTQLSALATVAHDGPLRLGDLAAAERIAPSTLTRLVSALEERGYLSRSGVPGDARAFVVAITEQGTQILDKIRQETMTLLTGHLLKLPPDQLAALSDALPALEHLSSAD